jgi:beta-barrel assembly-enhancing protease
MKRLLPLALILLAGLAAIIATQRQHIAMRPSATAILSAGADAQHELTRVPARLAPLSDADEIAAGNALATRYAALWPLTTPHDRAIETYLNTLGATVATHARRHLPWRFHYIPNPSFANAFALPGGHVFIGRGLINLMRSEDALAAVLGHEIEHIDLRHCAERTQTERQLRNLGPIGALVSIPVEVYLTGYTKDQELEADRDGTTLAVQSGYSPLGILQLLDTFTHLEQHDDDAAHHPNSPHDPPRGPITETAQLSLATLTGYFASHPPSTERATQIRTLITNQHWPTPPLRPLKLPPSP